MNKKIKVIELFDIIAKGIDIPTKVEYRQKIYKFDSDIMDYASQDEELCLSLLIRVLCQQLKRVFMKLM